MLTWLWTRAENDTLARIGTSCFQQLIEKNVTRFNSLRWSQIVDTFVQLFKTTTAHQLFDSSLRAGGVSQPSRPETPDGISRFATPRPLSPTTHAQEATLSPPVAMSSSDRRKAFKQIIVKCVLQLLLIDTTNELLHNPTVYAQVPPDQLLRLLNTLQDSYEFSKKFNADKDLRMALWKVGFMKQLPNLLKQESSSAATIISILVKMHDDERQTHKDARSAIRKRFVPLAEDIVMNFLPLEPDTQARNIAAWTPVVSDILRGVCSFEDTVVPKAGEEPSEETSTFSFYAPVFYPLTVELVGKESLAMEITNSLKSFLWKIGLAKGLYDPEREAKRKDERRAVAEAAAAASSSGSSSPHRSSPNLARPRPTKPDLTLQHSNADSISVETPPAEMDAMTGINGHALGARRPEPLHLAPHVHVGGPELEHVTPSTAGDHQAASQEIEATTPVIEISQHEDDGKEEISLANGAESTLSSREGATNSPLASLQ